MAPRIITRHPNAVRGGVFAVLLLAAVVFLVTHTSRPAPPHQPPTITMVMVQPPKPPPPPPPLPQPKIVQPQKVTMPQPKPLIPNQPPKPAPPRPATPSAVPLGTSIHNNGPADAFNLGGNPGGNGFLGGGGGGGGGGGTYGEAIAYAITQALEHNKATRNATAGLQVAIWVDAAGDITRVELVKSSGNPGVDDAVRDQVLAHLHLDPPPAGTAMPALVSLTGQSTL